VIIAKCNRGANESKPFWNALLTVAISKASQDQIKQALNYAVVEFAIIPHVSVDSAIRPLFEAIQGDRKTIMIGLPQMHYDTPVARLIVGRSLHAVDEYYRWNLFPATT
jgi:hypothetical protein